MLTRIAFHSQTATKFQFAYAQERIRLPMAHQIDYRSAPIDIPESRRVLNTISQIDRIRKSADATELRETFQAIMTELGFGWANLSVAKNMADPEYEMFTSNWPEAVRLKFHQWAHIDPKFTTQLPPGGLNFIWDRALLDLHRENEFIAVLLEYEVMSGAFASLADFNGRLFKMVVGSRTHAELNKDLVASAIIIATVTLMRLENMNGQGAEQKRPASQDAPGLSRTQTQILTWAAAGKSNADIADILGLSTSAVSYHLARIYKILGVATKLQAVAFLTRSGASGAG